MMNTVKKHIGTGKVVKKSEFLGANKVKVTYADLSSEELTHQAYKQVVREVREKKLTQSVFDRPDCPKDAQSAAIDGFGYLVFMNAPKGCWQPSCGIFQYIGLNMESRYYQVEEGYDTTDWQNSAINREVKS